MVVFSRKTSFKRRTHKSICRLYTSSRITAAASARGGSVQMAITVPFTPTITTPNPYLPYTAPTPSVRRVDVNGLVGWLGKAGTTSGKPVTQLTIELPQANGRMRDLGVSSTDLSADELLAIVSEGLSCD
jgi:hypothetical protein